MKSEKGITLIALVITIIVMLILVAVTVSVAINGGLIGKAEEAKNRTQAQIEKEQLTSAVLGTLNDDGTVNFTRLENGNLPTGFTGTNGTYTSSTGTKFTVNANGTVKFSRSGSGEEVVVPLESGKVLGRVKLNTTVTKVDLSDFYYIDDKESTVRFDEELATDNDSTGNHLNFMVQHIYGDENNYVISVAEYFDPLVYEEGDEYTVLGFYIYAFEPMENVYIGDEIEEGDEPITIEEAGWYNINLNQEGEPTGFSKLTEMPVFEAGYTVRTGKHNYGIFSDVLVEAD